MTIPMNIINATSKILKRERTVVDKDKQELLTALSDAKKELDTAAQNMNFVSDPMLLDHFTFKAKAAEVRYRYLICQAKQLGIYNSEYAEKMLNERYF